jgi:excisionase family DNA binding protein
MYLHTATKAAPAVRQHPGARPDLIRRSDMQQATTFSLDQLEGRVTITIEQAAQVLGLGRTAAYEAARRGELPTRRLGRRLLVPVPALLTWLGAN